MRWWIAVGCALGLGCAGDKPEDTALPDTGTPPEETEPPTDDTVHSEDTEDTVDTVDTLDTEDTVDTVDTVDTEDTVDTVDTESPSDSGDTGEAPPAPLGAEIATGPAVGRAPSLRCVETTGAPVADLTATWTVDGAPYAGFGDVFPGDTVTAATIAAGERWACEITSAGPELPASAAVDVVDVRRDIALLVDTTGSIRDEMPQIRDAILAVHDELAAVRPGDQLAVLPFVGDAEVWLPLQPLGDDPAGRRADLETLDSCHEWETMYDEFYEPYYAYYAIPLSWELYVTLLGNDAPHMPDCYFGGDLPPMSYAPADEMYPYSGIHPYYKESGTAVGYPLWTAWGVLGGPATGVERHVLMVTDGRPQCTGEGAKCDEARRLDWTLAGVDLAADGVEISILLASDPVTKDTITYYEPIVTPGSTFFTGIPSDLEAALYAFDDAAAVLGIEPVP